MVTEGIPVEPMMMFNQNSWGKENVKIWIQNGNAVLFNLIAYGRLEIGLLQTRWKCLERMWFLQPLQIPEHCFRWVTTVPFHITSNSLFATPLPFNATKSDTYKARPNKHLFVKLVYLQHSHYLMYFPPCPPAGLSVRKCI
jgi:hypothetical protein